MAQELKSNPISPTVDSLPTPKMTYEEFLALDQRSTEVSARAVEARAEHVFDNNGTREELFRAVDAYMHTRGMHNQTH